jgi:hypothetical protein
MASQRNTVHEADERAALLRAAAARKARIAINDSPIAQITTKTSNLPEAQQDKLLFEVFDILLGRNKLSRDLSPATVAVTRKNCKVKEKVTGSPERRPTQTKA